MKGNTVVAAKVLPSKGGEYAFDTLPDGKYNLVVDNGISKTTTMIVVSDGESEKIEDVSLGMKKSTVEVKEDAPKEAVYGLNELFDSSVYTKDDDKVIQDGGIVEIKLYVEKREEESKDDQEEIDKLHELLSNQIEEEDTDTSIQSKYFDLSVFKYEYADEVTSERLTSLDQEIVVAIPIEDKNENVKDVVISRVHEGKAQIIPEGVDNAVNDEYWEESDGYYMLHLRQFSLYSISYIMNDTKEAKQSLPKTGTMVSRTFYLVGSIVIMFGCIFFWSDDKKKKRVNK